MIKNYLEPGKLSLVPQFRQYTIEKCSSDSDHSQEDVSAYFCEKSAVRPTGNNKEENIVSERLIKAYHMKKSWKEKQEFALWYED